MESMRLQKYLAHAGVASRRASEELIASGRVSVNGEVVTKLGTTVVPGRDVVRVDGNLVTISTRKVYYLLNKPVGYVTTVKDPQGRPTVLDLVPTGERIYPVGRLDYDSEGLLLLTNDGELAYLMTHPSHEIAKTYLVQVEGVPGTRALARLAKGVELSDGWTAPAKVKLLKNLGTTSVLSIQIHEGRNRQVRRMCQAVGHPVRRLKRVEMGPLRLDGLKTGEYRPLRPEEISALQKLFEEFQQRNGEKSAIGQAARGDGGEDED